MVCHINDASKMRGLEIVDDLVDLIEESWPHGLSISQAAAALKMEPDRFRRAANALAYMGRIKIDRGLSLRGIGVLLLAHWDAPVRPLTERQKAVLKFMCAGMDSNNLVMVSYRELSDALVRSGVSSKKTYAHDVIECLDRKGYLEFVECGDHHRATLYRIYPDGDGPCGYSWPRPKASPRS